MKPILHKKAGYDGHGKEDTPFSNADHTWLYFRDKSDLDIWKMFRSGHEGAFIFIYDTYFDILFRYGCHFTNDRELIKDALHDLFLEMRQSKNLSDTDNIRLYLLKACRWKIIRLLKKKSRIPDVFEAAHSLTLEMEASPETKMIYVEARVDYSKKLNRALEQLTDRQKEALYYFYSQNLKYEEVAKMMGLTTTKSARNLIYKALDVLKISFKLNLQKLTKK